MDMAEEDIPLHRIEFWVCDLCLTAAGGECHVPGCTFWMQRTPVGSDLAWLRDRREWTGDNRVAELDAARARVAELEAAFRGHFRDVLGDIADSHIDDPDRRHELINDVVTARDEILVDPGPYAGLA